ncbi:TPA: hypothetical protein SAY52_003371 [Burkholderia cenocepacia]|nr:hypothetical protein [Burkholderia sp. BCC0801]HEF5872735.1 hypothetical protein [Burkholderia cenocepacia]
MRDKSGFYRIEGVKTVFNRHVSVMRIGQVKDRTCLFNELIVRGSWMRRESSENEKKRCARLRQDRVYICFNYYVRRAPDDKAFYRVIVSVFSRMNQIRFEFWGESVFRPCRQPCDVGQRTPGTSFAGGMDGMPACGNPLFVSGNARTAGHATRNASQV